MHVYAAAAWRAQKLRGKNATIRDDYSDVRFVRRKQFLRFLSFDFLWLLDRKALFECKLFDCGRVNFIAPAGGLIRLSPDGNDLVSVRQQSRERRHCGFRRAHENNAHFPDSLNIKSGGKPTFLNCESELVEGQRPTSATHQ